MKLKPLTSHMFFSNQTKRMKTILINIFFIALVWLISGCSESIKLESNSLEKQKNDEKQDADAIGWLLGLCGEAVTLSWETVFPEDYDGHSSDYADAPTYQQWQNIEAFNCFLAVLEAFANGGCSGNDIRMAYPYGYHDPWMR